jgi:hypothetical protein
MRIVSSTENRYHERGEVRMSKNERSPREVGPDVLKTPPVELSLDQVRSAIRGIRYGEVRVIIQDAVIVQIDRLERQRLC